MIGGNKSGYQSTVKMQFRGQDKEHKAVLGDNPNQNFEDDYILNLQQQIHFMELELRILKEKVIEDEKKSGIGSLYDDDKTSHQHIQLLKTKYAKMKRDFDRAMEKLSKENLKVIGEQFVLTAQIKIMREQNQDLNTNTREYEKAVTERKFDLEKQGKDGMRLRMELEAEMRTMEAQFQKASQEHYNNTMFLMKDEKSELEAKRRHDKLQTLNQGLIEKKRQEKADLDAGLEQLAQEYQAMAELQASILEAKQLREKIESAKVQI